MDRRWEERCAQAQRRADPTVSVVLKRERPAPQPPAAIEPASELPSAEHVLADLQQLDHITAANSGDEVTRSKRGGKPKNVAAAPENSPPSRLHVNPSPSFLSNTPRAMLVVVLVSNSVLFALLYAAGFLG